MTKDQKEHIKQLFKLKKRYSDEITTVMEILIKYELKNKKKYYINKYNRMRKLANENLDEIEKLTGKSYERYKPYGWWKENDDDVSNGYVSEIRGG